MNNFNNKFIVVQVPFNIEQPNETGFYEINKDNLIDIYVSFDLVEESPNYINGNDWWYVDKETGIVYIKFSKFESQKYNEFVEKNNKNIKLSNDERQEFENITLLINVIPQIAASKAIFEYHEVYKLLNKKNTQIKTNNKIEYRTKNKAGVVAEIPSQLPIITNSMYKNAMTYNTDENAYLQPISSVDKLNFDNGMLYFEGLPATNAQLKHLYTNNNIEEFNLPMLRVFYAIILEQFRKTWNKNQSIDDVITIYYPDLAKQLGKGSNLSQDHVNSTINTIISFQNIMGIINNGKKGDDILPVLVFMGNDTETNTISFASPYMVRVIKDIYHASIRKSKHNMPLYNKDGTPKLLPAYTYVPSLKLGKERNQKAVEIVCIIVATIEKAGNYGTPHISARTIYERNQLLKRSVEGADRLSNKNTYLERAFSKAWKLLRTHTDLIKKYQDIELPDPDDKDFKIKYIPTMSTLDTMIFEFPHKGKISKD